MTKAALKDCLGLPPARASGPLQILHCHPVAAPKSLSPRPSESLLLPQTPLQSGIPAYVHELSSATFHRLNAAQPAHQPLLLPNILTVDGIFSIGFGSPKTWASAKTLGHYHPLTWSWRVLGQGNWHWVWGTPALSLKDTGSSRPLPKGNVKRGRGGHRMSNIRMRSQFWWKALEQDNAALQRRSCLGGGMQSWVRAFHRHLMSNIRSFSAPATHYFYYYISAILAVLQMRIESSLELSREKEKDRNRTKKSTRTNGGYSFQLGPVILKVY